MNGIVKVIEESELVYRLGWALVHSLWLGAGIGAMLAAAMVMLRRRGPQVRYAAACAAMAAMVAGTAGAFVMMPARAMKVPVAEVVRLATGQPAETVREMEEMRAKEVAGPDSGAVVAVVEVERRPMAAAAAPGEPLATRMERALGNAMPGIVLAWGVGVVLIAVWQLAAWRAARRLWRRGTVVVEPWIIERAEQMRARLGIGRRVAVLQSMAVKVPLTMGWLKPVILVPVSLVSGLGAKELEMLLVHELAHIRRHDYLVNLLQTAVATVLFYHPAVWYIGRRMRAERENCCDDVAIAVCGDREGYAGALAACAGWRGESMAMAASGGRLLPRLRRILGMNSGGVRMGAWWPAGAALVLVGLVVVALSFRAVRGDGAASSGAAATQGAEKAWIAPDSWPKGPVKPAFVFYMPREMEEVGPTVEGMKFWRPDGSAMAGGREAPLFRDFPAIPLSVDRGTMQVVGFGYELTGAYDMCLLRAIDPRTGKEIPQIVNATISRTGGDGKSVRMQYAGFSVADLWDADLPETVTLRVMPMPRSESYLRVPAGAALPIDLGGGMKITRISENKEGWAQLTVEGDPQSPEWKDKRIMMYLERKDGEHVTYYGRDPLMPGRTTNYTAKTSLAAVDYFQVGISQWYTFAGVSLRPVARATDRAIPATLPADQKAQRQMRLALMGALAKVLPADWSIVTASHEVTSPRYRTAGRGWRFQYFVKNHSGTDWDTGRGGDIEIWIMDEGYDGKPDPKALKLSRGMHSEAPAATELKAWNGHRVFAEGGGAAWPSAYADIERALADMGAAGKPAEVLTEAESAAISGVIERWSAGKLQGDWEAREIARSKLDVVVTSVQPKLTQALAYDAAAERDHYVQAWPMEIANRSAVPIKVRLGHEWYGGEWPPTDLYVCAVRAGKAEPLFTPVFLAGERGEVTRATVIEAGKSVVVTPRMDWPGTGSVHGTPLVGEGAVYNRMKVVVVFEAEGKKQFVESAGVGFESSAAPVPSSAPATRGANATPPATAPDTTQKADDVLWSKPVAGLSGRLVAAKPTIAPGQAFTVNLQLRNTTDHPLIIQSRNPFCFTTTLKDSTGQPVRTDKVRRDVFYAPAFVTIEPGKTLDLAFASSAPDVRDATLDTVLEIWSLPLGTYGLSATYTSPAGGNKTPANAWTGTLDLAPITLTVAALQPSSAPAMSRPSTAGSVPTTAPRAAEMKESGWGDEVKGLQAELVVGNGGEYRRGTGLGLEIRVRNVGKPAVAYTRLGVVPEIEAQAAGDEVVRFRPVDQAPVNNNQGALGVGETLSWAAALERMEGAARWKAGTEVELLVRFGVSEGSERRGPGGAVTSLPVKVKIVDDFPAVLKGEEIPEKWSAATTLIYRERGMWWGWTWLKVDGQGRALLMRSDGHPDKEIPAGTYRATLSAEQLGVLAGVLRKHEFKERKDRWLQTDTGETTVVVSVGGAAARSQFEEPAEEREPKLAAFRADMRKVLLAVVRESKGAETQEAGTRGAATQGGAATRGVVGVLTAVEEAAIDKEIEQWAAGNKRTSFEAARTGALERSKLNVEVSAPGGLSTMRVGEADVQVLPMVIANHSAVPIRVPRVFYVSAVQPGKQAEPLWAPVYLAGLNGKEGAVAVIEPGKSATVAPQMSYPGMAATAGTAVVSSRGVYSRMKVVVVFEAEGKQQFATSTGIAFDGVLTIAAKAARGPVENMLPPVLMISAKNMTGEAIKWRFLSSELAVDGKGQPGWITWTGPVDVRWETLKAGEAFTYEYRLPDGLWKEGGAKKIQWVTQGHASNVITLSWKADASRAKEILAALSKTTASEEVLTYLRGLRLIGREALVAGLKDVLSPDRGAFTAESYKDCTLNDAMGIVKEEKLGELAPELTSWLKKDAVGPICAALNAFWALPAAPRVADVAALAGHKDPYVRRYLAGVLGNLNGERVKEVALLHQMVDGEDGQPAKDYEEHAFVKIWACQSLGKLGDRSGVTVMMAMLQREESQRFRGNVRLVLQELTGKTFEKDQEWIEWYKSAASDTSAAPATTQGGAAAGPAASQTQPATRAVGP